MPVDHQPSGPVLSRTAGGLEGEALRREAAILARARHPGVVELRAFTDEGTGEVTLVTAAPTGTRLPAAHLSVEETAGLGAVLATTLADLHDIGIAHRRVTPAAVVIAADGRPVLCDFAAAVTIPGSPARRPSHQLAKADVRALGALLLDLRGPDVALTPRRSPRRRRPRDGAALLADLAAAAAAGRMTARTLADRVATEVAAARLPDGARRVPPHTDGARLDTVVPRQGRRRVIGALAAIVIVLAVGVGGRISQPSRRASVPASAVEYADGVLTLAGHRFAVGRADDVIALGRWQCGPSPTVALLRPSDGEIWVFDGWPAGGPLRATPVARIPGAATLHARSAGRCDALVVGRTDGSSSEVRP